MRACKGFSVYVIHGPFFVSVYGIQVLFIYLFYFIFYFFFFFLVLQHIKFSKAFTLETSKKNNFLCMTYMPIYLLVYGIWEPHLQIPFDVNMIIVL